jgi:hypothetical protein
MVNVICRGLNAVAQESLQEREDRRSNCIGIAPRVLRATSREWINQNLSKVCIGIVFVGSRSITY